MPFFITYIACNLRALPIIVVFFLTAAAVLLRFSIIGVSIIGSAIIRIASMGIAIIAIAIIGSAMMAPTIICFAILFFNE